MLEGRIRTAKDDRDALGGLVEVLDAEGHVTARGYLVVDLMPDATATDKVGATLRFVSKDAGPGVIVRGPGQAP